MTIQEIKELNLEKMLNQFAAAVRLETNQQDPAPTSHDIKAAIIEKYDKK